MATIKLDYGLDIQANAPVDKRIVVNSLADLQTNAKGNTFEFAYDGLTVSVLNTTEVAPATAGDPSTYDGGVQLWQLVNAAPYKFGSGITLSYDNFKEYWQCVGSQSSEQKDATLYWDDLGD